jgi:hypothetical protein
VLLLFVLAGGQLGVLLLCVRAAIFERNMNGPTSFYCRLRLKIESAKAIHVARKLDSVYIFLRDKAHIIFCAV